MRPQRATWPRFARRCGFAGAVAFLLIVSSGCSDEKPDSRWRIGSDVEVEDAGPEAGNNLRSCSEVRDREPDRRFVEAGDDRWKKTEGSIDVGCLEYRPTLKIDGGENPTLWVEGTVCNRCADEKIVNWRAVSYPFHIGPAHGPRELDFDNDPIRPVPTVFPGLVDASDRVRGFQCIGRLQSWRSPGRMTFYRHPPGKMVPFRIDAEIDDFWHPAPYESNPPAELGSYPDNPIDYTSRLRIVLWFMRPFERYDEDRFAFAWELCRGVMAPDFDPSFEPIESDLTHVEMFHKHVVTAPVPRAFAEELAERQRRVSSD